MAVARLDGRVELIDAETLRRTGGFEAFPGWAAAAIDYSADGRRLAVAGEGGGVGVWDVESGEQVGALLRAPRAPRTLNPRTVQALAFGQGDLLAAADTGGAVRIWDVGRRELLRPPLRLPPSVHALAFSPDGSQLAIPFGADSDKGPNGVEILDVGSGERVARLSPDGEVRSVAFSPDGGLLAGGMVDGGALLWASDGWGWVGGPLARQNASTLEVEFSPDGHTLATSHSDHSVALWDVASQEPIGPPLGESLGGGCLGDGAIRPRRRPPVRAIRPRGGQCIEPRARDPLGGRSRALAATRMRRRRQRPHSRAVGRGRARAGLRLGLPLAVKLERGPDTGRVYRVSEAAGQPLAPQPLPLGDQVSRATTKERPTMRAHTITTSQAASLR